MQKATDILKHRWAFGRTLTLGAGVVPDPMLIVRDDDPVRAEVDGNTLVLHFETPGWARMMSTRQHFIKVFLLTWLSGLAVYLVLSLVRLLLPSEPFAPNLVGMTIGLAVFSAVANLAVYWRPRRLETLADTDLADSLRFLVTTTGTDAWGSAALFHRHEHWAWWFSAFIRRKYPAAGTMVDRVETTEDGRTHIILNPGETSNPDIDGKVAEELRQARHAATWHKD